MLGTKVKICGLRRTEDIEYVNELKPDYVGFVFAKSKRQVTPQEAAKLIERLDKSIKTVGVFVDEAIDTVKQIKSVLELNVLQFHGTEEVSYLNTFLEQELWKAVSIETEQYKIDELIQINQNKINRINKSSASGILLDSETKGIQGGTGTAFNWDIINRLDIKKQMILAGGLNCDNVDKAIKTTQPDIVDVSSGVETDGFKDYSKIKDFIEKVRGI